MRERKSSAGGLRKARRATVPGSCTPSTLNPLLRSGWFAFFLFAIHCLWIKYPLPMDNPLPMDKSNLHLTCQVFFLSLIKQRGSKALAFTAIISKRTLRFLFESQKLSIDSFSAVTVLVFPVRWAPLSEWQRKVTEEGKGKLPQCPSYLMIH